MRAFASVGRSHRCPGTKCFQASHVILDTIKANNKTGADNCTKKGLGRADCQHEIKCTFLPGHADQRVDNPGSYK